MADHTAVEDAEEEVVEEVIPTGTVLAVAETTPVAIPTGMKTYGLDIVVKFNASRSCVSMLISSLSKAACLFAPLTTKLLFFFSLLRTCANSHSEVATDTQVEVVEATEAVAVEVETSTATAEEVVVVTVVVEEDMAAVELEETA